MPVSVKAELNDIDIEMKTKHDIHDKEMKIQITALWENINFSECFLKLRGKYYCVLLRYGL